MKYAAVTYTSLRDRHVLITGGASGIGAEMVRAFRSQNAVVSFLDIDAAAGQALAAETGARFHACDVTDVPALRSVIEQAQQDGPVRVLVNNAARDNRHDMAQVEAQDWRQMLAVNLDHQFFATQAVADGMAAVGGGSVIMMGSISWRRGRAGMVAYTTAKAAISGLTRTMSRELGPQNIRVNCIMPGAILTVRQRRLWLTDDADRQYIEQQALKFRLDAHHVARMALFLGSDESAGATGAEFVVDAGLLQN